MRSSRVSDEYAHAGTEGKGQAGKLDAETPEWMVVAPYGAALAHETAPSVKLIRRPTRITLAPHKTLSRAHETAPAGK